MKKPENFRKIDGVKFATKTNNEYKFSVDTPKGNLLWIFSQPDTTTYSLAFVIDWEKEVYEIKRAKNGDGKNWIDTLHSGNFDKHSMETMSSFVIWAHNRVLQFEHNYNNL
jgi:hypothetical protein